MIYQMILLIYQKPVKKKLMKKKIIPLMKNEKVKTTILQQTEEKNIIDFQAKNINDSLTDEGNNHLFEAIINYKPFNSEEQYILYFGTKNFLYITKMF